MNAQSGKLQAAPQGRATPSGRPAASRVRRWLLALACVLLVLFAPLVRGVGLSAFEGAPQGAGAAAAAHEVAAREVARLAGRP